jgi:hypothetical protein
MPSSAFARTLRIPSIENSTRKIRAPRYLLRFFAWAILAFVTFARVNGANIALQGTGDIGLNTVIDSNLGTSYSHAGVPGNVNDGNLTTSVDTYDNGGGQPFSYTGVLFSPPRVDLVQSITLSIAAFFDGGWFGPNNSGPGATGQLTPAYLTEPTVQITLDNGNTWTNVPATSNYVSALTGTVLPVAFGPATHANPATFTLTTPQTGITGIRLIGSEGGTASGGFLGVYEVAVDTIPEPSTALVLMSGVGLLTLLRRRHKA